MRINHNIPALRSQHSLGKTNGTMDKVMERLSSGLRINRAGDDAAGLAIANKMQTQVRGLKVASRNSLDGVSLVQTAEGALAEVQSMLQRMRELAVQGANGTLAAEDRRAIQNEVSQLTDEVTKTANLTEFNRIKLLNGQIDRRSFTNDEKVTRPAFVSDTVIPGSYNLKVLGAGLKAKASGDAGTVTDGSFGAGRININGEEVDIKETDSPDVVFAKLRDLCERVDIELTRDATWGSGGKLYLETKEFGSEQKIEIKATNVGMLANMGLKNISEGNPTTGTLQGVDAKVELKFENKGFQTTATVTTRGNRVEITDANYQRVYLDIQVNDNGTTLQKGTTINQETGAIGAGKLINITNVKGVAPVAIVNAVAALHAEEVAGGVTQTINFGADNGAAPNNLKIVYAAGATATDATAAFNGTDTITITTGTGANNTAALVQAALTGLDLSSVGVDASKITVIGNVGGVANTAALTVASTTPSTPTTAGVTAAPAIAEVKGSTEFTIAAPLTAREELIIAGQKITVYATDAEKAAANNNTGDIYGISLQTAPSMNDQAAAIAAMSFPGCTATPLFPTTNTVKIEQVTGGTGNVTAPQGLETVNFTVLDAGPLQLQVGPNEGMKIELQVPELTGTALGLDRINMRTAKGCSEAIAILDTAINEISSVRSKLGAYQNRLEHTIANIDTTTENTTAALSRIQDADMAFEMAQYTQKNILAQAGVSMLAQANQRPQAILQLLQG